MEEKEVQKERKWTKCQSPAQSTRTQVLCLWRTSQRLWRASRLAHSCDERHTWCDERHTSPLHFWRKERFRDVEGELKPMSTPKYFARWRPLEAEAVTQGTNINSHLPNLKGFHAFSIFFFCRFRFCLFLFQQLKHYFYSIAFTSFTLFPLQFLFPF
jgi:hypothetical protein